MSLLKLSLLGFIVSVGLALKLYPSLLKIFWSGVRVLISREYLHSANAQQYIM